MAEYKAQGWFDACTPSAWAVGMLAGRLLWEPDLVCAASWQQTAFPLRILIAVHVTTEHVSIPQLAA